MLRFIQTYYSLHRTCTGSAFSRTVLLKHDARTVLLPVDLDAKLPIGKCFVPETVYSYLSPSCEVLIPESVNDLLSVTLEPINQAGKFYPSSVTGYVTKIIRGMMLANGEPFALSIGGRLRVFRAECIPAYGVVTSETNVSLVSENGEQSKSTSEPSGFKRVGGLSDIIDELVSTVKKPLLEHSVYEKFGLSPPKGVLLFGPPGTGKTLLARAICEELPSTYVEAVKATDLCGPDSDTRIHEMFKSSKRRCLEANKSSILVFIDEIDALCPSRDSGVSESERRAVAALLTEMDGFSTKSSTDSVPLAIIGATNRPNSIDIALRRPGRFEREIEIPPPDQAGRFEILKIFASGRFASIWVPTDAELNEVASLTHGFVGADISSLISQAAFKAVEAGSPRLSHQVLLDQLVHVKPSALRELAISVPKTTWTDIGGYQDVKSQLIEAVIWPTKYASEFSRLGVSPPRGVLLYGPPGCSKTMMARAVATESSMNFISVKGPEIFSKWVGESEQAIRDLFRKARQASPCVIFFDEIDAIASPRESGDGGVSNRVLTQLLTEMDGVSSLKQVVVIAATNRPHVLDPALMRPGRLDRIVYVGLPDRAARASIWGNGLGKLPHRLSEGETEFSETLVDATDGYSGAEIVMAIKEAAILCIKETIASPAHAGDLADQLDSLTISGASSVTWSHMMSALSQVRPRTDQALLETLNEFKNRTVIE